MATHTFNIDDLQELCAQSIVLSYNLNAADTLEISLRPEAYAELNNEGQAIHAGDRIVIFDKSRKVFSGYIHNEPTYSVQGGDGENVSLSAASDWSLLEKTVYAKQAPSGEFIYPGGKTKKAFIHIKELAQNVLDWATNWPGNIIETKSATGISQLVPVPDGNGVSSCADLILSGLTWSPHIYFKQLYSPASLYLSSWRWEDVVVLGEDALITNISLTERSDIVPPVCALVGAEHYILPEGGDIREPGAFVYAVPYDKETAPAGSAEASQKMEIRGIALPERSYAQRTKEEYEMTDIPSGSHTEKFLRRFFPQYADFLPRCLSGALVASVVTEQDMKEEAETELEEGQEFKAPANYSEKPENWAPTGEYTSPLGSGVFVMTEGSFTASTNKKKNLKGLRWCKARLEMQICIDLETVRNWDSTHRELANELFPGKLRGKVDKKWRTRLYARLGLDCVLINRSKRVYDAATNKPFRADPEWSADDLEEPTASEYKEALNRYYNETRLAQLEGEVSFLLNEDSRNYIHPANMLGCGLSILGKRETWDSVSGLIRGVNWAYGEKSVTLSVGPREVLGFEEELQRILLERFDRQRSLQRLVLPFDTLDEDAQNEQEQEISISPNISASVSTASSGKPRKPWTLYEYEDNDGNTQCYIAGGNLYRAGQHWNVPDSAEQFTREAPNGEPWDISGKAPRIKWEHVGGAFTWSIYQPKDQ